MAEVPAQQDDESSTNTIADGYFEEEYYINAEDAGEFLVELGEQLRDQDEITITGDDWELPFAFGEPVNLDIEFEGNGEPELEIEVELGGRVEDEVPDLE
ncbi:MAG: amphi-Trp domain-containing protein [Halobacteriales archaeon]